MGQFGFRKPSRIAAKTAVGRAGVINIERESNLSGPTHNKEVLTRGGFLRSEYSQKTPFPLSASIVLSEGRSDRLTFLMNDRSEIGT